MLKKITNILNIAKTNLLSKINVRVMFIASRHFQERLVERFIDEDLNRLERTIEKAEISSKIRYTHPTYNITVVGQKMGLNGFELITCFKGEFE